MKKEKQFRGEYDNHPMTLKQNTPENRKKAAEAKRAGYSFCERDG